MRVYVCDHYEVPLPPGHRFPMEKYRLLRETLLERGLLDASQLVDSPLVDIADLLAVHDADYTAAFLEGRLSPDAVRRIGFPWSAALVRRCRASVAGTVGAAHDALEAGAAGNLAGGTHHAHAAEGAGYCVFNDIAVAVARLLAEGRIRRACIFDCDVHQGDGTATIFAGQPAVFTASLHGARNFPLRKATSDLDVELPDGTGDDDYLPAVADALAASLERSRPDVLFYQAGVDGLASDRLGRLALSHAGLRARDELVLSTAAARGLPIVLTLGGGYADPISDSIEAHASTYAVAREVFGSGAAVSYPPDA